LIVRKPTSAKQNSFTGEKKNHRGEKGRHWKKGTSGNPKGRPPRGFAIAEILRRVGDEEVEQDGKKIPRREQMLRRVYEEALKGQSWAVHFIADRTEGKVVSVYREEGGLSAYRGLSRDELERERARLAARVDSLRS
jgi:hypothetical protein